MTLFTLYIIPVNVEINVNIKILASCFCGFYLHRTKITVHNISYNVVNDICPQLRQNNLSSFLSY